MSFTSARRDLRLVVLAKAISFLGDEVAAVALVLRLQSDGAGAAAIAALLIANLAPIVLLTGVVGRLVDRRDNRMLLVASGLAQAGVCAVLAFTASLPAVLGLVALLGIGQSVNGATWQALVPSLVPPERLARALSLVAAATTCAGIAAPALSGVLVGSYGARVPLLVDTATFVVIAAAASLLRNGRVVTRSATRLQGGLSIVRRQPVLRSAISMLGLFVLLGSMVNVVEVFLVRETLGASTLAFGLVGAAYAVGLLGGALGAGRLPAGTYAPVAVGTAAGLSLGLVGFGLAPTVAVLMAVALATGSCNGLLNVCTSTLVTGAARPDERGRVGALVTGVVSGTQLAAYAVGGTLATVLAPRIIFVGAGTLGLLAPLLLGPALLRAARPAAGLLDAPVQGRTARGPAQRDLTAGRPAASPHRGAQGQADFSRRSRLAGSRGTRVG